MSSIILTTSCIYTNNELYICTCDKCMKVLIITDVKKESFFKEDTSHLLFKSKKHNDNVLQVQQSRINWEKLMLQTKKGRDVLLDIVLETDYTPKSFALNGWLAVLQEKVSGK